MVDWQPYLTSVATHYEKWWQVYTITDVEGKISPRQRQVMLLDLMVGEVKADRENPREREQVSERLDILTGLRKYSLTSGNHVLLQGKPGSGKSTALARLLLEESEKGLTIPVLIQLRYYKTSILDLIRAFLQEHSIQLEIADIENHLQQKQFFLLIDGINELPSDAATTDLKQFRKIYKTVPMVFTTRELGLRGDLDIEKKLAMQPLNESQMKQFVKGYLGNEGENLLKQLGNERLKRLGETPLLLLMLCSIYANNQQELPRNLGETFRAFTKLHDEKLKADATAQSHSKALWADSLQYLAFTMTERKNEPAISQAEAEEIIGEFLRKNNEPYSLSRQRLWLGDLINHHLLQRKGENEIEFHHQLIQEYYAAEYLLRQIEQKSLSTPLNKGYLSPPSPLKKGGEYRVSDEELQRNYLNYLKWTETLALMLGLVKDETQAVRVVKLALEVDWLLCARLAGEVRKELQAKTVESIKALNIPKLYKVWLLGETGSDEALTFLYESLKDENFIVRWIATEALGKIGSSSSVSTLIAALQNNDSGVRWRAAEALGKMRCEDTIPDIKKLLNEEDFNVQYFTQKALEDIEGTSSNFINPELDNQLKKSDYQHFLDQNSPIKKFFPSQSLEEKIASCLADLNDRKWQKRLSAVKSLEKIGTIDAFNALIHFLQDNDGGIRIEAVKVLEKRGDESTITELNIALKREIFIAANNGHTFSRTVQTLQVIKNRLKFYKPEFLMNMNPSEVFISYAWRGESEELTNQLEAAFQTKGITIIRDKNELGYKELIKEFMQRIGQGKCVIVVISDRYLKSKNCMFELLEIAKNGDFYHRIFPIILPDAKIYNSLQRLQYIQHWETEINTLDAAMKTVSSANLQGIREDIDLYTAIRQKIAELTDILQNMNTLTPDIHRQSDFDAIINAVTEKLNSDTLPSPATDSPTSPQTVQNFYGNVQGVAGNVQGNQQINSATTEIDTQSD